MWYRVMAAAKYLGVPPWELAERPFSWVAMAEEAAKAEGIAQDRKQKDAEAQAARHR